MIIYYHKHGFMLAYIQQIYLITFAEIILQLILSVSVIKYHYKYTNIAQLCVLMKNIFIPQATPPALVVVDPVGQGLHSW